MNNIESATELPLLPLRGMTILPNETIDIVVGREKSITALEKALAGNKLILVAFQLDQNTANPKASDLETIAVVAKIESVIRHFSSEYTVKLTGKELANLVAAHDNDVLMSGMFTKISVSGTSLETQSLNEVLKEKFKLLQSSLNNSYTKSITNEQKNKVDSSTSSVDLAFNVLSILDLSNEVKKEVLTIKQVDTLLEVAIREVEKLRMLNDIDKSVKNRIEESTTKYYKEHMVREKINALKEEIGEDAENEISDLEKKLKELNLNEETRKLVNRELKRLSSLQPMQSEYAVIFNYLTNISELPWGKMDDAVLDIKKTKTKMDTDHYGMDDVKERILEQLAVIQNNPEANAPILCLAGPPGVGKTTIAKSIADSMNRKFVRVSLGGVRDESEIRGHRRTYVGAMAGRIMAAIKKAGVDNPVILLDEIDKLTSDQRGDPSSALLEVLDPGQNKTFKDHFIDLEYDLSKVFFIATANYLENIQKPLLDRMELIKVDAYLEDEKLSIAKEHLIPKISKNMGIKFNLEFEDDAVMTLIRNYTAEPGVRGLERNISTIIRKSVKQYVSDNINNTQFTITEENLEELLGQKKYTNGSIPEKNEVGLVNGMAYSYVGGDLLQVEVVITPGTGRINTTGSLGEVMQESAKLALTYVKSKSKELKIKKVVFEKYDINVHFPDGSTPKDGPSAGITMVTAIVSAIKRYPARRNVSMTGEVSLRGKVLPIGGLREKITSAVRGGIDTVIIPKDNLKDLHKVPDKVLSKVKIVAVEDVSEVLKEALVWPESVEKKRC